ncbi:MAG: cytochrome b/b6 domain-containing protein [Rhizobiales bacterium]|nr:cytochrome b/b6 domain-containing protein [Hyphomicrobiales bacterium]
MSQVPSVRVWDPAVRAFHWGLAASILAAWLTSDEWTSAHIWVGYLAGALVTFRVVWGFAGSPYARFKSFVQSPRSIARYLADMVTGRERRYLGHNPAGGAMIVALLATVALLGLTGWMQTLDRFWGEEWLEGLHEFLADGLLVLIAAHITGVLLASWRHGENLVFGMISGRKRTAVSGDVSMETIQAAE